jgi:hypothetical protein
MRDVNAKRYSYQYSTASLILCVVVFIEVYKLVQCVVACSIKSSSCSTLTTL